MRRLLAEAVNALGNVSDRRHLAGLARASYGLAARLDPTWSTPLYNFGLMAKYAGEWQKSLEFNRRAVEVNPKNEAAWWNLGIAATAMHNWQTARMAWKGFGIEIPDEEGEVRTPPLSACVRLDPNGAGEVVWGERLDPARIAILNVPLPESNRRYYDIILNDGAPNGTRMRDGHEVPVFDELMIWKASDYSTFQVSINVGSEASLKGLVDLCDERVVGIEDWSTIRTICAQCSRGDLGPHDCEVNSTDLSRKAFGFAARSEIELMNLLRDWATQFPEAAFGSPEMLLPSKTV